MSPTTKTTFGTLPPEPEEPLATPQSVANNYFQAELDVHHRQASRAKTDTIVILNDAVYGHRFSRPRTSKTALNTIVERPERIKAGVLGVSAAYVRLGERHLDGALPPHPKRDVHALPSIPFRILKTTRRLSLTSPAVTNVHGTKWMDELKMMCQSAESILANGGKELQRPTMNKTPDSKSAEKFHEGDLYLCSESLDAMEGALGAVCEAVDTVFSTGPRRAFVAVRPPGHHCSASHPSGFCWVNNVHVGIMHAALKHGLTHAAIIDFDLHHGDGSQTITWQHNTRSVTSAKNAAFWKKTSIGYFSLHDINSYPCEGGDEDKVKNASLCIDNAHGQSVWNVHLLPWKTEEEFWHLYETKYHVILEKTRNYLRTQAERLRSTGQEPKAAIFFSAGFDASEWESAGMQRHQVNVPTEFYARLTQDVIKLAAEEGLAIDGRVISVLEGGYSDRALFSGILSHLSGLVGKQTSEGGSYVNNGLGFELGQKLGVPDDGSEHDRPSGTALASIHPYDSSWWASTELDQLENTMSSPPSPPKKPRSNIAPAYFSPTQASTAKVLDPIKTRRSLSGLSSSYVSKAAPRPPSPPPPDVPWMVAAHELSKLLIPAERQTDSCTHEDLNAEATRIRRDRQSSLPPAAASADRPTSRMSLRERKSKPIGAIHEDSNDQFSSKNRRKTVATSVFPIDRGVPQPGTVGNTEETLHGLSSHAKGGQTIRRASRRVSGSSIIQYSGMDAPSETGMDAPNGRPETFASGQPVPATNPRIPNAGKLPMKKARPPTARKDTAPKTPRNAKKATHTTTPAGPSTSAPGPDDAADALENITAGMRKIKINLITQSQKDARGKARVKHEPASSNTASQSDRLRLEKPDPSTDVGGPISNFVQPKAVETSSLQSSSSNVTIPILTAVSSSGLSTPVLEHYSSHTASPEVSETTPRMSSAPIPQVAVQSIDETTSFFVPYQPEGPEPVALSQQEPLKWLPPNIATPSANTPAATPSPVKKNHLFQYTSGIPFAPRPQKPPQKLEPVSPTTLVHETTQKTDSSSSVWDVPSTPRT